MHMCKRTYAHSIHTGVMLLIQNISFLKMNHWNLWGPTACNWTTSTTSLSGCSTLPASSSAIYHPHISINNQVGIQLVTWKACESHVTDQSSREAAHSLRWFTAQQFVPRSAWIHAVYLLYMKLSRLEICICQTSPITPAACHTWGSSQPTRKKRRSVAVSTEPSADWKGTSFPISLTLISSKRGYFSGSPAECWVNERGCVRQAEAASFCSRKH